MAQWTIQRACGHTTTEQIYGPVRARQERADYLATLLCWECRRERGDNAAKAVAVLNDLPELTGSERQIAWAMTIRSAAFTALDKLSSDFEELIAAHTDDAAANLPAIEATRLQIGDCYDRMEAQTAAAWWIDHRGKTARQLLAELSK